MAALLEALVPGLLRAALRAALQRGLPPGPALKANRAAVASLRLLGALITDVGLRSDVPLLRRLLPHLFKPLAVECLCKVRCCCVSRFCRHARTCRAAFLVCMAVLEHALRHEAAATLPQSLLEGGSGTIVPPGNHITFAHP